MDYRREIDGLRALAVVPVILFHAGWQTFGGGFVGVDVFFVISGYLITTIILNDLEQGKFSIVNFYERRARRILPALFFVMFACLPLAWLWLLPEDMKSFSQSLVAVPAFLSNVLFWRTSGYFDGAAELKPLLHTWSLAVEEQYYVIFPLFLALTWGLRKHIVLALLGVFFALSLAAAHWGSFAKPAAAFYLLPTRGWELLFGVFVAFYLYRTRKADTQPSSEIASLLGVVLILYAVFAFSEQTPFPSLYTLVPTLGTALIILFGTQSTMVGKLLGHKLLVGIGLISYSAYLWHQPLIAFAKHRSLVEPSKLLLGSLALLSILLAYVTWKYVECPFRDRKHVSRKAIFTGGAIASLIFFAIGIVGHINEGFAWRFEEKIPAYQDFKKQFVGHKLRDGCVKASEAAVGRGQFCRLGDTSSDSKPVLAVFGDSHANALNPVLDTLGRERGKSYVYVGLGGCPALLGVDVLKGNAERGECEKLAARQYEFVKASGIRKVVLISRWSLYTDGDYDKPMAAYFLASDSRKEPSTQASRKAFEEGLSRTIRSYRNIGVEVTIVLQVPQQTTTPESFYTKLAQLDDRTGHAAAVKDVSVEVRRHLGLQAFSRDVIHRIARKANANVIDPDKWLCDGSVCSIGDSRTSFYRDKNHVNTAGAMKLATPFEQFFQ